jgi:hypothetical protein
MHHVPVEARPSLLSAIEQSMAAGGSLVFKDWMITANLVHLLCLASDRYLTGDDVSYFTMSGVNAMLADAFGPDTIRQTSAVGPWRNNIALLVQPSDGKSAQAAGKLQ